MSTGLWLLSLFWFVVVDPRNLAVTFGQSQLSDILLLLLFLFMLLLVLYLTPQTYL